jgi:hypothetical protein
MDVLTYFGWLCCCTRRLEFGIWGGGADLGVEFAAVPAGIGVEFVVVGAKFAGDDANWC